MKPKVKYENTKSVKQKWPNLTVLELAQGQNQINGSILATTHRLYEALDQVLARLEALEAASAKGTPARKAARKASALPKAMSDAADFIQGIGGKEPPGCRLPDGF
jgi:hypothetical protein